MNIIIEVTRECNLYCEHCLRGEPQNKSIQEDHVRMLFDAVKEVNLLTLSGGEPALYPEKIQMIADVAREMEVDVHNFYLATNGTVANDDFLKAIMEMYLLCSENEISSVDVSNDVFHEQSWNWDDNMKRFKMFNFTKHKYQKPSFSYKESTPFQDYEYNYEDFNHNYIIKQGRGELLGTKEPKEYEIDWDNPDEIELYLNCNGTVINGCDWSYENQEKYKICAVKDLKMFLKESH